MSPHPDVSEDRRSQIIEAATAVFAHLGFHRARMDDIAEKSGVSKGTLYWYFESKDDIISACIYKVVRRDITKMGGVLNSDLSAKDKLLAFTRNVIEEFTRMQPLMPIMFELLALLPRRKTIQQALNKAYRSYTKAITPIIQEGIDRGEFRLVDAEKAAIALGSIFEGTILLWAYEPETIDFETHLNSSVRLLIEGLEAR